MFVGDKGKILAGFLGQEPRIISGKKPSESQVEALSTDASGKRRAEANALWVAACHGGPKTYGDFLLARPITDAFNLAAISLRMGGKRLRFDSAGAKVTNIEKANQYLTRDYRKGWELPVVG